MTDHTYPGYDFETNADGTTWSSVMVHPEPGESANAARILLGLADHPGQVRSTMDGVHGVAFVVPSWLADRYDEALAIPESEPDDEVDADETQGMDVEDKPAPKRRGRPPGAKSKVTTDSADQSRPWPPPSTCSRSCACPRSG
jgi:hypothetical protein